MKRAASNERSAAGAQPKRTRALGRLSMVAIALIVPHTFREEFAGDLLEELRTSARLRDGSHLNAQRWLWRQIVASTPSMLRCRLTQGGRMAKYRWAASAIYVAIACLQAWDSHVLRSTATVGALVGIAIALPTMAMLLAAGTRTIAIVYGLSIVLLLSAKIVSPIPLPALGVISVVALAVFIGCNALERRAAQQRPPNEPAPTA